MNRTRFNLKGMAAALLVTSGVCGVSPAHAQTTANADAMYNGFLKAYLIGSGNSSYFAVSFANRGESFQWQEAYLITGVEDAYDRNKDPARQALISGLLNRYITTNFTNHSSTNLNWDGYNDDAAWATIALMRGYQITGNKTYLTYAGNVWNNSYSRGWDSTLGGGIWETSPPVNGDSKCSLSNFSFIPSGIMLYQSTGDTSYLTRSEAIYNWTRANLFNTTTGQVNECVHPTTGVDPSTNVYNSGLLINAARYFYRITGNKQYYNDAVLAANFQINRYPIMTPDYLENGPFGADQFFRGLAGFARENGLWSTYSKWFQNNATAAWNERRTDYNITHNDLATPTPTSGSSNMQSMEMESAMVLQQVAEVDDVANPFIFTGNYELLNTKSSLAVSVANGSTANSAAIVQEPFTGANDALFKLAATGGGYYTIQNVSSGKYLNVAGASTLDGAEIIQWNAQPQHPGNDQWMPVVNTDGTYTFFNLNSQQVLDNFTGSLASGNQFDQWVANQTAAQSFHLISH